LTEARRASCCQDDNVNCPHTSAMNGMKLRISVHKQWKRE
jgi:hypothetical protein